MDEPDLSELDNALGSTAPATMPTGNASLPDLSELDAALAAPKQSTMPKSGTSTIHKPPQIRMAAKVAPPAQTASKPASPMAWSDVGQQAVQNFVPSFKQQVVGAVEPLLPQNWGNDVKTAVQLAKGAASKTGFINQDNPSNKVKDEQLLNSIGSYYKNKYGTMEGFKHALAADPASFLTDASAALSLPAGGEGLLAKLPGVLGEAGSAAARGAGAISRATNPVGITAKAASAVLPKTSALNVAGKLNNSVKNTIGKTFGSNLSADDIAADPAASAALQATVKQKGVSPAAMKEALLRRFAPTDNQQIPRSTVTGKAPPVSSAGMVNDAISEMKNNVAKTVQNMTGNSAPSETAIGDALQDAQIAAHNHYTQKYSDVSNHAGQFDPKFVQGLTPEIENYLSKETDANTVGELANYPSLKQTRDSIDWLGNHLNQLTTSGELTPAKLMGARRELGQFRVAAKGADQHGVGAVIDAFDEHLKNSAQTPLYIGGNGPQIASDMTDAIGSYRGYKQSFSNTSNPTHGAVASAMKQFLPDQAKDQLSGMITSPATSGSSSAAQGQLVSKLLNPKTLVVPAGAEKLYDKIAKVSGNDSALKDYVRQSVTKTINDPSGAPVLAAAPDQIHSFLKSPLADKVFSPEEQSTLKQAAEAQRILTTKPSQAAKTESLINGLVGKGIRVAGAGALGHVFAGPVGGFAAAELERGLEASSRGKLHTEQMRGAPGAGNLLYGPGRAATEIAKKPPIAVPASSLFYGSQPIQEEQPKDDDQIFSHMLNQESGNSQFNKNGSVKTSPKGAIGAAQVMPKTGPEAAQLAGEPWDEDRLHNDPDYNIKLGKAYYNNLKEQFDNPLMAAAAYNAGPKAVKNALADQEDKGGSWIDYLPNETKNYVNSITSAMNKDEKVMRAKGGKVESKQDKEERLIKRLISLAKSSKIAENKKTEHILGVKDDVVAKALHIAQKAI